MKPKLGLLGLVLVASACADEGGLHIVDPVVLGDGTNGSSDSANDWGEDGEDGDEAPADEGIPPSLDEGGEPGDGGGAGDGDGDGEPGDALTLFVEPGGAWRYTSGAWDSIDWTGSDFDDSTWAEGNAPLGDGFDVTTPLPPGPSQLRTTFNVNDPSSVAGLLLRLRRDDGAIVWLNGGEVFRSNMPANGMDSGLKAQSRVIGLDAYQYYHAFPDPALLQAGPNVLAVSLHPHPKDDDIVIDAMLRGIDPDAPPEALSFRVRTNGYSGKYGPKHVGAIWLEDADGFVRTFEVWGDNRREHLVAWRASSDENDVDAVTGSTRSTHGTHQVEWALDRLDGTPASPGTYRIQVEYTEANSNSNAAAGPQISVEFELGAGPTVLHAATEGDADGFTELLLYAP